MATDKERYKRDKIDDIDELSQPFADDEPAVETIPTKMAANIEGQRSLIMALWDWDSGHDWFEIYRLIQAYFESEVGFTQDNAYSVRTRTPPPTKKRWVNIDDRRQLFPVLAQAAKDAARAKIKSSFGLAVARRTGNKDFEKSLEERAQRVCGFIDDFMMGWNKNPCKDWWLPASPPTPASQPQPTIKEILARKAPEMPQEAVKVFERAINQGLIEVPLTGDLWRLVWKGSKVQLAYLCEKICCPTHTEYFPETMLNRLFGVERLGKARTQMYDAKTEQRWRQRLDRLFE